MNIENQDFELKKGNEYTIKPYWKDIHFRAKYVGNQGSGERLVHVFVFEEDKKKKYAFMYSKYMGQEGDGVLAYSINLSFPPRILIKDIQNLKAGAGTEQSKLLKILEDLGESL